MPWPPKLTIEIAPVLKLFTGTSFYSSADAALREAVLNAIDAIGRRRETDPNLSPEIEVVFSKDAPLSLQISDNGVGMDEADVESLFAKVGASASKYVQQRTRPIGEFGIGALSYFLVCDRYELHTVKDGQQPVGVEFSSQMLDGETSARSINCTRTETGTTLLLFLKDQQHFDLLKDKFPHWIRNVEGLSAKSLPGETPVSQGGLTREVLKVTAPSPPAWIETYDLGPPKDLSVWDHYDGHGHVDVLYRGVFVERIVVEQLWGLEGAIHVDPKHFRPKLNREGFVGDQLKNEVMPFLREVHPHVLEMAVECIREVLSSNDKWSTSRVITLWLAVPRSAAYANAVKVWDSEFRSRKSLRLLSPGAAREISITDLIEMSPEAIYLAPEQLDNNNPIISQSLRILRAQNEYVVQGIERDGGYLSTVSLTGGTTSWLLLHIFRAELKPITDIATVAPKLIAQQSVAELFSFQPKVKLIALGSASAPFIVVNNEVWINIENAAGKNIVTEVCRRNEGHLGLWVACMMFAADNSTSLNQLAAVLQKQKLIGTRLGLMRRKYILEKLK